MLVAFSFIATLFSCSNKSGEIEYLPCKMDKGDDWGFVNAKGEVFCKDAFKECPSVVRNGVFFVGEGDLYSLYKFEPKKPVLLLEDIKYKGRPRNGIMPICRKDSHIEVIDVSGKVLFTLEKIDNQEVTGCRPGYSSNGYLTVFSMDADGKEFSSIIDKKGKIILKPKYKDITVISDDLFFVAIDNDEETEKFFVNRKGEKQTQWKKDLELCSVMEAKADRAAHKYVCAMRGERCYIYDLKGNEILKCSEKVRNIVQIKGNVFVFEGANDFGIMNLKGEKIVSDKYEILQILEDGNFLAEKNDKYELLDSKGEAIEQNLDYEEIAYIEEFGIVAVDNNRGYILNDKLKIGGKEEFYDLEYPNISFIRSDYFDYAQVVNVVESAIKHGLKEKGAYFGNKITNIPTIISKDANSYKDSYSAEFPLAKGSKYTVNVNLDFTSKIAKPIYKTKTVQKYNYWYGYYNTTEEVVDGYQFNTEAKIDGISIVCDVPYDKKEKLHKELKNLLSNMTNNAKKSDNNEYVIGDLKCKLSDNTITINNSDAVEDVEEVAEEVDPVLVEL